MGTSPVIVRPQPVRRRLPDAPSARDAELAEAIRRGDERALDRLLAHRWAPLVSYVAGRVGDVELAKDIVQEAFVLLWSAATRSTRAGRWSPTSTRSCGAAPSTSCAGRTSGRAGWNASALRSLRPRRRTRWGGRSATTTPWRHWTERSP